MAPLTRLGRNGWIASVIRFTIKAGILLVSKTILIFCRLTEESTIIGTNPQEVSSVVGSILIIIDNDKSVTVTSVLELIIWKMPREAVISAVNEIVSY
jgi:hypothetical protein